MLSLVGFYEQFKPFQLHLDPNVVELIFRIRIQITNSDPYSDPNPNLSFCHQYRLKKVIIIGAEKLIFKFFKCL